MPAIVPAIPRPVVIVNVPFAFVIETTSVVPVPSRSAAFLTLIVVVPVADCTREVTRQCLAEDAQLDAERRDPEERPRREVEDDRCRRRA